MSKPLPKRTIGIFIGVCFVAVLPAYLHVNLASGAEPFYGPPTLADMIFWVSLPAVYLSSVAAVITTCIIFVVRSKFNWPLLLSALPLLLGVSMVVESMAEYAGDQYRQFNENQAYLEAVEAQLERATADPPNLLRYAPKASAR